MSNSKTLDPSLYFDSFVTLFEELDAASLADDLPDLLVKKVKSNHGWFLDSVARFKSPNRESNSALDCKEIAIGSCRFEVKKEMKDAAIRASKCLGLDEAQSYILVSRVSKLNKVDIESYEFVRLVLLQYYHERQCLLKCIRRVFAHALYLGNGSSSSNAIVLEAVQLVHDGLEKKLVSILIDLLSSAESEKSEVDFTILWVEESVIEDNLILDTLFLVYYDNFCSCSCEQWKMLSSIFKDILNGSLNTGILAVSFQAKTSFDYAKSQLLLILIETLDLENLLQVIHDEVSFSQGCSVFSSSDVLEMDVLVSSFSTLGVKEVGPFFLAWAVFICLLSTLQAKSEYSFVMEIDHIAYLRQAFEGASFDYLLEILRSDALRDSDGPISGYLSVLRTVISAFIASYELNHQTAENTVNLILDILSEIYHGEDSLSMQFWDRDSCVDEPIRSLLYMLENEYPFHTIELVRLLSALCSGMWSAECVYNYLEKMSGVTLLSEIPCGFQTVDSYDIIIAQNQLVIPSVEGLVIPSGTPGQIVKIINANTALVRWEFAHSGLFLLLLRLTQKSNLCRNEEVSVILDLLRRMVSSNKALCFSLLCFEKSVPTEATQNNQRIEMNVRVDLAMIICTVAFNLVQDVNNSHIASNCIHILAEILKCAPCHATMVVSRSKLFGTANFGYSSNSWLLSGGLARMLLADNEENGDCSLLAISVLDFTTQLVEKGGDDSLSSTLVVFCLQYILVNHMQWKYKTKHARWKVTLKVLEVMKGCINAIQTSHKLGSMIRDILFFDTSIHSFLFQIICIPSTELERSNVNCHYELKETECLKLAVCSGLNIVCTLLDDFLKLQETLSNTPIFVQTMLSSTSKPVPIAQAAMMWLNFTHNSEIQFDAAKVLSKLIVVTSRVQRNKIDNVSLVTSAKQIKDLSTAIFCILDDEMNTNEDLLTLIFDLLTSAACYQPTFLVSLMLTEEDMKGTTPAANSKSSVDLILKYVKRSEILIKSSPRVLLNFLNLLKALWDGGVQYLHILEKIRGSEMFWKHMSSILAIEAMIDLSAKILNVHDVQRTSYRYLCQGTVLDILACEMFLLGKLTQNEISQRKISTANSKEQVKNKSIETSKSFDIIHSIDILSTCFVNSTMSNLLKLYPSSEYDKEVILQAKMSVCMCVVHLIDKLSTGDTGSLSMSLVEKVTALSQKLSRHPAFSALIAQYASQGYSEGKQLTHLVLNDLYYHMQGELEGRQITQGPFQELAQFLLEFEFFQRNIPNYERDICSYADVSNMFDTNQVCSELGLELWEFSGWKSSVEVAEKMLLHMQNANSVMILSYSKNSALKALVSVICEYNGNLVKTKSRMFDNDRIEPSIKYVCKCLHATGDSLVTTLSPPHILLEQVVVQAELLFNLSITIFRQNLETTKRKNYLPLTLLLIKTSGSCIKLLADVRPSSTLLIKTLKFLLTLLLTSVVFIFPKAYAVDKSDLEVGQFSEASFTSIGLLPILCKYVNHAELSHLSVASIDLLLKAFLAPNTWLPILESHLHLQNIVQIILQTVDELSVHIVLNFLLTLARTKSGARMLYSGNIFSGLKRLFDHSLNDNERPEQIWGLCLAIITSTIHSLGDDPSFTDIIDTAVCYFFSEKDYILSYSLSVPSFSCDEYNKKRARDQNTGTSFTALRLTEQTLALVCVLAKHQSSWTKCMKEMEPQLIKTCIHLLAFISKGMQRIGDSPNQCAPVFCSPTLKEEIELNEEPALIGSKHGWFRICSVGLSAKTKSLSALVVNKDQSNGNADISSSSQFSDMVAIQMYRIALLLLKVLCMLAQAAAKRAEELEFIDLAYFPELPMPEILHGLQDQAIAIVTELCEIHKHKSMQQETENICFLLLHILEKALFLELCVSQSCGLRPVLGRIEDFSKAIKVLLQVMERHPNFKSSLSSLSQIIALVYPGLLRSSNLT